MHSTILAIDIGSSSIRVVLFDRETWEILHVIRVPLGLTPHTTPEQIRELVESALDQMHRWISEQSIQVEAVAMCTFVGNLIGLDHDDQVITRLYTYANQVGLTELRRLMRHVDPEQNRLRTGTLITPSYYPAQIAHIQTQSDLMPGLLCDLGIYLYRVWFARSVPMGISTASWSGMLNRQSGDWDDQWLDALHLHKSSFPPIAPDGYYEHGLSSGYTTRWPLLAEARFYPAVGDGAAANIGMGADQPDTIGITIGTTTAIRRVIESETPPPIPPGLWSYRVDHRRHLIGGSMREGGNLYAWARKTFNLPDSDSEVDAALLDPNRIGSSVRAEPLLSIGGTLSDLRFDTLPLDILDAIMTAHAARVAEVVDLLSGDNRVKYHLIGGGGALLRSRTWLARVAQATGKQVELAASPEPSAYGAARLVAE